MKILILTLGSRGDVQPFVALGIGLKQIGHEVTICTASTFENFITSHGLNYAYMNDTIVKFASTDAGRESFENADNPLKWVNNALKISKQVKPSYRQALKEEWAAAQGVDAIAYHPKAIGGYHIAEKLGIPGFMCLPFPLYPPTKAFPCFLFPDLKLGGWYNQLTYTVATLMTEVFKDAIDSWRQEVLNLPPHPFLAREWVRANGEPVPILHGYSPHVVPPPADWPDRTIVTGYWFLDPPSDWQPPGDLVEFLAAEPPPVYVGFGSIAGRNPHKVTHIVLEALARSRQRGIIAKGWGGLQTSDLPENVFAIESAPHAWLFPQVAAVIHHGGAGTTAAGLRAGKPTIVCPFFGDQPFWGQRVFDLGVGPKPIPQKQLTADRLTDAIAHATTDEPMRQRAADLAEKIRAEEGIERAIAFIEQSM